jgi:hypothetical protein
MIWDNKPNQIERNVCCLNSNEGGMGMINIDNFVKSKQIKFIYKIVRWTCTHHVQHLSSGGGVEVLPVPSGDGFEAEDFYQLSRSVDIISELIKFYIVKHFRGNS